MFELMVDDYVVPVVLLCAWLVFDIACNGVISVCDLVIDVTGG